VYEKQQTGHNYLGASEPGRDRGQIDIHLERVCALGEEALKLQHEIEARLSGVCRPAAPTPVTEAKRPQEVLVPIAEVLSRKADQLELLVDMQRDLLRRIAL